jgi:GH25 family lysozyme M1 (1,4-beta-N-acetylmuramidase)
MLVACAALAVGTLGASCLLVSSGLPQAARTSEAASSASPAEGHSPRLEHELAGPLAGTGPARPGSAALMSTSTAQADTAAAGTTVAGIDVASFQHPDTTQYPNGAPINWTDVAENYQFAAIKATEGNYYVNSFYASDAAQAVAAGMYVSAYHFANPNPANGTATAQAEYAYTNAGDYTVGGQYLPLMLDIEYNPYPADGNECYNLSPGQMITWISQFVTETQALTGAPPIIYTPTDWWNLCTSDSAAFSSDMLWTPSYSSGNPSTLPAGWTSWSFWQYSSSGNVPGIDVTNGVDLDTFTAVTDQETFENTPASLQIETLNALAGQSVTYSATGLPPGLTMSASGLITGTPTTLGSYSVTVTPSPATVLPATISFTWDVTEQPAAAMGAEGGDGALWVQAPQLGGGWQSLGGQIAAPPAVAAVPNANGTTPESPLFIATAPNHELWLRSLTAGWEELGPVGGLCLGPPAAVVTGSAAPYTLTVACEGTNRSLWETQTQWSGTGLPTFTGWTNLGGILSAGPAVAPVGGTLTYFVLGTNGAVWTSTGGGFSQTSWDCIGAPAAATQAASGVTTFACQGTDNALWTATNSGSGWSGAQSLGGQLIGGPGIAATSGQVQIFAEGADRAVWEWTYTSGLFSLGGVVSDGVGAGALN